MSRFYRASVIITRPSGMRYLSDLRDIQAVNIRDAIGKALTSALSDSHQEPERILVDLELERRS